MWKKDKNFTNTLATSRIISVKEMANQGPQAQGRPQPLAAKWTGKRGGTSGPDKGLIGMWQDALGDLKRLVAALGVGRETVEDILQDVYLKAMKQQASRGQIENLRRWLFRVTINRCREEHRRRTRRRKAFLRMATWFRRQNSSVETLEAITRDDREQAVRLALAAMDEKLKTPMVLRYFQGMNSKEIAGILEVPDATIRTRLRQGRMKLAAELRKVGYEHD